MDSKQHDRWPLTITSADGTVVEVALVDGTVHLAVDRVHPIDPANCTMALDVRAVDDLVHALLESASKVKADEMRSPHVGRIAQALIDRSTRTGGMRLVSATPHQVARDTGLPIALVDDAMQALIGLWMTKLPGRASRFELPAGA